MHIGAGDGNAQNSYVIGYITDLSGPLAESYTPTWEGFELYIKALNDRGGINDKKVDVVLDDDGLKADRAVAMPRNRSNATTCLRFRPEPFEHAGAGLYGNAEGRRAGRDDIQRNSRCFAPAKPYSYSTGVVFEVAGAAIGELLRNIRPGGMVVGITIDSVGGRAALANNKKVVEAAGYKWDEVRFPVTTTDFTPFAQAAVEKKPDIVVGHMAAVKISE